MKPVLEYVRAYWKYWLDNWPSPSRYIAILAILALLLSAVVVFALDLPYFLGLESALIVGWFLIIVALIMRWNTLRRRKTA